MSEMTSATIASTFTTPSGLASTCMAGEVDVDGAGVIAEDCRRAGAGLLMSGCVCCILTVALGIAGLPGVVAPSAGRVMRAVSFFGAAWTPLPMGSGALGATPLGLGAGLSGTVGRAPLSDGGLGGACTPLDGLAGGSGMPACDGGRGGGGTKGRTPEGGGNGGVTGGGGATGAGGGGAPGTAILAVSFGAAGTGAVSANEVTIFVVSFFGEPPKGGTVGAGLPGRLMRTVSRFTVVG